MSEPSHRPFLPKMLLLWRFVATAACLGHQTPTSAFSASTPRTTTTSLQGCVFVGHRSPDVDSVASAVFAAWMYNGVPALPDTMKEEELGKDVQLVLSEAREMMASIGEMSLGDGTGNSAAAGGGDAAGAGGETTTTDASLSQYSDWTTQIGPIRSMDAILGGSQLGADSEKTAGETKKGKSKSKSSKKKRCVVLVDHNSVAQRGFSAGLEDGEVFGIFDHHRQEYEKSSVAADAVVVFEKVGATANVLLQEYLAAKLKQLPDENTSGQDDEHKREEVATNPNHRPVRELLDVHGAVVAGKATASGVALAVSLLLHRLQIFDADVADAEEPLISSPVHPHDPDAARQLLPPRLALLLLYAILSDTVNLSSPTTTDADRKALAFLQKVDGVPFFALEERFQRLAAAKDAELQRLSIEELLNRDAKTFEASKTCTVRIAVAEFGSSKVFEEVWENKWEEIATGMGEWKRREVLNLNTEPGKTKKLFAFFFLVNTEPGSGKQEARMLFPTQSNFDTERQLVTQAFAADNKEAAQEHEEKEIVGKTNTKTKYVRLPGVVSRKLQMLTLVDEAKQLVECGGEGAKTTTGGGKEL
eukprot:g10732.t1